MIHVPEPQTLSERRTGQEYQQDTLQLTTKTKPQINVVFLQTVKQADLKDLSLHRNRRIFAVELFINGLVCLMLTLVVKEKSRGKLWILEFLSSRVIHDGFTDSGESES